LSRDIHSGSFSYQFTKSKTHPIHQNQQLLKISRHLFRSEAGLCGVEFDSGFALEPKTEVDNVQQIERPNGQESGNIPQTQEITNGESKNSTTQEPTQEETRAAVTPDTPIDFAIAQEHPLVETNGYKPAETPEDNKKAVVNFQDLPIAIENPAGSDRTGTDASGKEWKTTMQDHYGEILTGTGADGDAVDVFVPAGLSREQIDATDRAYVIDQINPENGQFDEHKVMIGFNSLDEACLIYKDVFSDGSGDKRLGAIVTFPEKTFHEWLCKEGATLMPASRYQKDGVASLMCVGIKTPAPSAAMLPKPLDEAGGVIIELPDMSKGPKLKAIAGPDDRMDYHLSLFSALETEVWSNTIDVFCRTLDFAKSNDTIHIHIASPGGSVFLMGRIVSAIKATKAKVITYAQGCVASAANTVWISGHERHILPGAYFMQHMSSQGLGGKSSDIAAKSSFCVEYISKQLQPALEIGLFTDTEVKDMVEKSSDIYISGREASVRIAERQASVAY